MLKVLAKSVRPLFYLSILTFLVILFFALLGIEFFQGKLHGGCYANYTTPAGELIKSQGIQGMGTWDPPPPPPIVCIDIFSCCLVITVLSSSSPTGEVRG